MKNSNKTYSRIVLFAMLVIIFSSSCKRDLDELDQATFPTTGEVFIDGFSSGLAYAAFGGSKVTAFNVDSDTKYKGSASMIFEVPDAGDPAGGYAGGVFYTESGRDLTGYNTLTFWAKASKAATIDLIGFGNDLGESKYQASIVDVAVNSSWTKYYIPIPDPAKLTQERGMLFYSEGPEDGKGYSFWIDEVKFEMLGTIAHGEGGILNGQDQIIAAETGDELNIGGLFSKFNLPSGVDQRVETAPSYFSFFSSQTDIAMVNQFGVITVIDSGQTIVNAMLGDLDVKGSMTINAIGKPIGPEIAAPVPMVHPDSVISMYSNAYDDVPVDTWNTYWQFSTAVDFETDVNGDDIRRYKQLNFVGIEFSSVQIDATEMTHFHMDIWTPDPTDLPAAFKVLLIDFGADGSFDGGDDSSHEISVTSPTLATKSWVSIDVPLSSFAGLTSRKNLAQMVLSGDIPNVFIDNVYFYISDDNTPTGPTESAPDPMQDAADVISIFSDTYTNVPGTNFYPDWGQATVVTEVPLFSNNTLLYQGLNYQGVELDASLDISDMDFLHIDYWTSNSGNLNTYLISPGPVETPKVLPVPTSGWASMEIPLADFNPVDLAELIQMKFDGSGDIYLDNIFFYKTSGGPAGPTVAAPTPAQNEVDVISIYSDSYTNLAGTDFNPGWGQSTVYSEVQVEGNNTILYSGLDYQGIQLAGNLDASGMDFLHLDVWTENSTAFNAFLISDGPVETAKVITVPTSGWLSVDVPLGEFSPVDMMNIIQCKFDGNGDIYMDNLYFYKNGGSPTEPTQAAPTPTANQADVISVYSDAYSIIDGTDYNPGWGQATIYSEVNIGGDNAMLYTGLNYQGIQLGSSQDLSEMEFLHIDFWTSNSTALNTFIISNGPVESAYALTVPTSGWASVDIPLSSFSPVDLADVIQLKFDGNGDIYLDNIYFYKTGSTAEPTLPLTFEDGVNPMIAFDGGATAAVVDNPDMNGNTSTKVLQFNKVVGSAWYSGVVFDESLRPTPLIDLADGTVFTFKIWSPKAGVPVRMQLEGGAAPAYEVFQTIDTANEWVTLTFDFSSQVNAGDSYPRFAIFPDFDFGNQEPVAEEAIYFIDDFNQE